MALADNACSSAKVYAVDSSLLAAFSVAPTSDLGQRLETAVYDKLRRKIPTARPGAISRAFVGEGSQRQEVDFVIGDALVLESPRLVQVCASPADAKTEKREITALSKAMSQFGVEESWLVTLREEEERSTPTGVVHVVPAWKWLLD